MQKATLKITLLSVLILSFLDSSAQKSVHRLHIADSLFEAKRYTQALEQYHNILQNKEYSPAMFLKMAFIYEGLGQINQSLYYLNLYYTKTQDPEVKIKMMDMAEAGDLIGYEESDLYASIFLYRRYHSWASAFLGALCLILLARATYVRFKSHRRPVLATILLTLVLIVLGVHVNLGRQLSFVLVNNPQPYLMSGPSGGSKMLVLGTAGDRLLVIGKEDVWLKVYAQDRVMYIKQNHVLPLEL